MNLVDSDPGPEVFESSDVEEASPPLRPEQSKNEDIISENVHLENAKSRYETAELSGELTLVDFLGAVNRSLGDSGFPIRRAYETRRQKLARIAAELEELQTGPEEPELKDMVQQLEELVKQKNTEPTDLEKHTSEVFQEITEQLQRVSIEKTTQNESTRPPIAELEKRLRDVENAIGEDPGGKNIRLLLNDLGRKVDVIYDPQFELDPIRNEIRALNEELEGLLANKRRVEVVTGKQPPARSSVPFESKINYLYDKLPAFEEISTTVPYILTRLRSLNRVHAETTSAVSTVTDLANILGVLKDDMAHWNRSLDTVNTSLDKQNEQFANNAAVFEEKLAQAETRVAQLESKR